MIDYLEFNKFILPIIVNMGKHRQISLVLFTIQYKVINFVINDCVRQRTQKKYIYLQLTYYCQ